MVHACDYRRDKLLRPSSAVPCELDTQGDLERRETMELELPIEGVNTGCEQRV